MKVDTTAFQGMQARGEGYECCKAEGEGLAEVEITTSRLHVINFELLHLDIQEQCYDNWIENWNRKPVTRNHLVKNPTKACRFSCGPVDHVAVLQLQLFLKFI
ncbi:Uncharacterized protein Fot_18750 [Forsythia ovata]|uniref:Uncharacterized protein n=1 Tax=Forsythia ovata TaxID=205694 RepID=A0ABD1VJ26_9LAMI